MIDFHPFRFLREIFSEEGQGSFSRVASGFHTGSVLVWISHFVWYHGTLPDPATLAALSGFAIAPYAANQAQNAISSFSGPQSDKPLEK